MDVEEFRRLLSPMDHAGQLVLPVVDPAAPRVYGGQLLAQMIAACRTVSPKEVSSINVAFPRECKPSLPVNLDLSIDHDGRSLGVARATVWQPAGDARRIVAVATVLLDAGDDGTDYPMSPPPSTSPDDGQPASFGLVPGEARLVSAIGLDDPDPHDADLQFWMRCAGYDDDVLSRAAIAYMSDWPLIGTLIKAVPDMNERDAHVRLQTGVVAHTVWFHSSFDASQWLHVDVRGHHLSRGRGFGIGSVHDETGRLVASFAQQNVIREFATNSTRGD